jgi:hypothetical protein
MKFSAIGISFFLLLNSSLPTYCERDAATEESASRIRGLKKDKDHADEYYDKQGKKSKAAKKGGKKGKKCDAKVEWSQATETVSLQEEILLVTQTARAIKTNLTNLLLSFDCSSSHISVEPSLKAWLGIVLVLELGRPLP